MARKKQELEVVNNAAVADATCYDVDLKVIKNVKARQGIRSFMDAEKKTFTGKWGMVEAVSEIVKSESFKDDFGTKTELARFLNISNADLSKMSRITSFENIDFKAMGWDVTTAYELLSLDSEDDVIAVARLLDYTVVTQKEARQAVKDYKNMKSLKDTKSESNEIPDTEEQEGQESAITSDDNDVEELFTDYTLPIWNQSNGGFVDEKTFSLSETNVEYLSRFVAAFMISIEKGCTGDFMKAIGLR